MEVTRDDLRNYQKMKIDLDSLDLQIETAYDTYKSPQLTSSGGSRQPDPGDPVSRALARIERLKQERANLVERMEEIEKFVQQIDDWYERAICRIHYIEGYTWEATCLHLRKHHSFGMVADYDRIWWKNRSQSDE